MNRGQGARESRPTTSLPARPLGHRLGKTVRDTDANTWEGGADIPRLHVPSLHAANRQVLKQGGVHAPAQQPHTHLTRPMDSFSTVEK